MSRGIKAHTISDEKFKEAIKWLEDGNTKKGACEILGVGSNATMERLIQEWQDQQVMSAEMKKKKRGTPLQPHEIVIIIESYLQGDSLDEIANRLYRSTALVKAELERRGANLKFSEKPNPLNPPMVPDQCISETFEVGELVWVPGYQTVGEIKKALTNPEGAYRVWLLSESKQQNVHYMNYDLASLKHLEALGVNIKGLGYNWSREDTVSLVNEAVRAAIKREKEK